MSLDLSFNPQEPRILHIDLNSCFATIEQQANPLLRGKPIVVAAYDSPRGCVLAASVEAKKFGIKTGMRVQDGKILYPGLLVLTPDPWKYRTVHLALRKLLSKYTYNVVPKSIDEFVLNFSGFDKVLQNKTSLGKNPLLTVGAEIKRKIKEEIGDWLTVSIGVSTNRFLAKVASNLKKPDGSEMIDNSNFLKVYNGLNLTDLPYIKNRNAIRLNSMGIYSVSDFYKSPLWRLKAAFHSINGYYWHTRLHGYEIDNVEFGRRSYGNSYSLPKPFSKTEDLLPILAKLCEKTGFRLRKAGYQAKGVHLGVSYRSGKFFHHGMILPTPIYDSRDIYKAVFKILSKFPSEPVLNIAVSVFGLLKLKKIQLNLFEDVVKRKKLTKSVDLVNKRWGNFVVYSGRMAKTENYVPDRIAFGGVKEPEEFTNAT